ncbi:MAG: hypothetical protein IIA85_01215 [Nanoarchaeota archaeon]|nr:hypothetical protein [Nanoarchaeota archaeon]
MKEESNENLIHLKFNYDEALNSKRDILYSQRSLITITKIINNYLSLKSQELSIKLDLRKKLKETATHIKKLQKLIPDVKIPKILRKDEYERDEDKKEEFRKPINKKEHPVYDNNIESQLQEIQEKLQNLQK